jgi:hypothetical protein
MLIWAPAKTASLKFWGDDEKPAETKVEEKKAEPLAEPQAAGEDAEDKGVPLGEYLKFWEAPKDEAQRENQYRILVDNNERGGSDVVVITKEGTRDTSATANRITTLLYEQLR